MSDSTTEEHRSGRAIGGSFPQEWRRGPARIDGEWIVLDVDRARIYNPMTEAALVYDLAAVRRPPDALAFVQRYGLLRHGPEHDEHRERYSDFEHSALSLSNILRLYTTIGLAVGHDEDAAGAARDVLWALFDSPPPRGNYELIERASRVLAQLMNEGLAGVDFMIAPDIIFEAGKLGAFSLSAWSPTLLGSAYHQLALEIVNRVPLRACVECGRFFPVGDKRQQFCSPTCGSRARQRRYAEKKKLAALESSSDQRPAGATQVATKEHDDA